jgi:hypothetical protein
MIAMQAETLAGLIGFGGAVVGAAGALAGAWLQQHYQAKTAQRDRIEAQGRAAGERALAELYALRRHLDEVRQNPDETPETHQPWRKIAWRHMDEVELAVLLMPGGGEVRSRVVEALDSTRIFMVNRGEMTPRRMGRIRNGGLEAIAILAAHLRGETLPEPSQQVLEYRSASERHTELEAQGLVRTERFERRPSLVMDRRQEAPRPS